MDQWNIDGDCSLCRRKDYCKTRCKKNKIRSEKIVKDLVLKKLIERMNTPK